MPINLHETTREVLKGFLCRSSNEVNKSSYYIQLINEIKFNRQRFGFLKDKMQRGRRVGLNENTGNGWSVVNL